MLNLQEDLSILTNVSQTTWRAMNDRACSIIAHYILEAVKEREHDIQFDTGIGSVDVHLEGDTVQMRFNPSAALTAKITKAVRTGSSPLVEDADRALCERFTVTYKELV